MFSNNLDVIPTRCLTRLARFAALRLKSLSPLAIETHLLGPFERWVYGAGKEGSGIQLHTAIHIKIVGARGPPNSKTVLKCSKPQILDQLDQLGVT